MGKQDHQSKGESRRQFLTSSGLVLGGLALPRLPFVTPAAAAQTTVKFAGWAFEPQVVEANAQALHGAEPRHQGRLHAARPPALQREDGRSLQRRLAAATPSTCATRTSARGSRPAGCSRSTACPALRNSTRTCSRSFGKLCSTRVSSTARPITGISMSTCTTRRPLQQAGIEKAPATLGELKEAALEIKKAGAVQYPILKGFKTNVDGLSEFWSMVFASGGHLFNEALDPVYPERGQDRTRRARMDGRGHARLEDPRSPRTRARRDPGARRLPQRPGHLHLECRQRLPARE